MEEVIYYAIVLIIAAAAGYYSARKAQRDQNITAGTVDVPTAEAGRPIMVLAGTRIIKSPNCGWYGDIKTSPIQK
jgi:hypothetical protein